MHTHTHPISRSNEAHTLTHTRKIFRNDVWFSHSENAAANPAYSMRSERVHSQPHQSIRFHYGFQVCGTITIIRSARWRSYVAWCSMYVCFINLHAQENTIAIVMRIESLRNAWKYWQTDQACGNLHCEREINEIVRVELQLLGWWWRISGKSHRKSTHTNTNTLRRDDCLDFESDSNGECDAKDGRWVSSFRTKMGRLFRLVGREAGGGGRAQNNCLVCGCGISSTH